MAIIFDIETGSLSPEKLEGLMPTFEPDKRLKDPEKVQADIDQKKSEWLSKAALSATTGKVLAIGTKREDEISIEEGDEALTISRFWDLFRNTTESLCGHNILKFDIPFLIRRSWALNLWIPPGIIGYYNPRFIDTMKVWGLGNYQEMISLDNLAKFFGVGKKSGKGSDFAMLYSAGPDGRAAALEYLKNDLELTAKCAQKMGL